MAEAQAIIAAGVNLEPPNHRFPVRRLDNGFDNGCVTPELQRDNLARPAVSKAAGFVKPHPPARHVDLDDEPPKKIRAKNAVAGPLPGLPIGRQRRHTARSKGHALETKFCASESVGSLFTRNAIDGQTACSLQVERVGAVRANRRNSEAGVEFERENIGTIDSGLHQEIPLVQFYGNRDRCRWCAGLARSWRYGRAAREE